LDAAVGDTSSVPQVASGIAGLVRQGLGLPTLTGCARFASRLVMQARMGAAGPESKNALERASGEMLRAFTRGLSDPSATVRKEYARTIGQLCAVSKPKEVERVVKNVVKLYTNAELKRKKKSDGAIGGVDDEDFVFSFPDNFTESTQRKRLAAGETCKYMASKALEATKRYDKELLPVAFIALHDPDKETKAAWEECWNDCTPGMENGLGLYLEEVIGLCISMFQSPSYFLKKMSITALEHALTLAAKSKNPRLKQHVPRIISLTLTALQNPRFWSNKSVLFALAGSLFTHCSEMLEGATQTSIIEAIHHYVAEPGRGGRKFRLSALACAGTLADALPSKDMFASARVAIGSLQPNNGETTDDGSSSNNSRSSAGTDKKLEQPGSSNAIDDNSNNSNNDDNKHSSPKKTMRLGEETESSSSGSSSTSNEFNPVIRAAKLKCLGKSWPRSRSLPGSYRTMLDNSKWVINTIARHQTGTTWNVRVASLEALVYVFESIYLSQSTRAPALSSDDAAKAVDAVCSALEDQKYAAVRLAGLKAAMKMGERGKPLGVIMPGKSWEKLIKMISTLLKDKDPGVVTLATKVLAAFDDALNAAASVSMETEDDAKSAEGAGENMYL